YFQAASAPIPEGVSIDAWVDEDVMAKMTRSCGVPRREQAEITIDGRPARLAECSHRVEATVVDGGRLYLFVVSDDRRDTRAHFDAWIATIDLTPDTAASP